MKISRAECAQPKLKMDPNTSRQDHGVGFGDSLAVACDLLRRWKYANDKISGYDGVYEGTPENDPNGKLGEDTEAFLAKQAANGASEPRGKAAPHSP